MGKVNSPGYLLISAMTLILLAVACSPATPTLAPTLTPTSIDRSDELKGAEEFAPLVKGLYKGGDVQFIHTEASDPDVAALLTGMMGAQVVVVPGLAQAPESILANVYVFTNGIKGMGPFGFQPDFFDSVPGDQGYSPLRAIVLATWIGGTTAGELRSVDELETAESKGELAMKRPGVVVNISVLTWPGGHR